MNDGLRMTIEEAGRKFGKNKNRESSDKLPTVIAFTIGLVVFGVFMIPLLVYAIWAYAFVGKILWGWFVTTTFGLKPLTMAQAWGLSILISMWTYQHHVCKSEDERKTYEKVLEIVILLLRPWLILLMGWVCYHYFIPQ